MTLIKFFGAASLAVSLFACQTLPQRGPPAAAERSPPPTAPVDGGESLIPDLIYSVLAGEVATQRSRFDVAHKQYLYAARVGRNAELAGLATRTALAAQESQAAREAVGLWLELEPGAADALQIAALLEAQAKDLDRAAQHLRRLLEMQNKAGGKGYLLVVGLLAKLEDGDLRLKLMRRLVSKDSRDPDALFALGMLEASVRNFAQAEDLVRKALKLRPEWGDAKVFLVRMLISQEKKSEARRVLEGFLKQAPEDVTLRAAYARMLVEQEALAEAREQFKRVLRGRPGDADTLFALGVLSMELKDRSAAQDYFQSLYKGGERSDEAAFYLGQIHEDGGAKDMALDWYQKAQGKSHFDAQVRIARIRAERGEVRGAREILQQLRAQAGPDSVPIYLIEEEILRDIKQYEVAMEVLNQALAAHPDEHDLLYARALLAVPMGRLDILERDLRRIIERDPKHADALNALGYTLADQTDRYQEARGYIQRALDLKPDSPAILDSMGWLQYRLGNYHEALRYLRRAFKLLPDAEIAAHLGEVLWVLGERAQARQIWGEALERDPDSEPLQRAMGRLRE